MLQSPNLILGIARKPFAGGQVFANITMNSILSDISKQGMQIEHEVQVVLSAQATREAV